jgi:hypothetical protein
MRLHPSRPRRRPGTDDISGRIFVIVSGFLKSTLAAVVNCGALPTR